MKKIYLWMFLSSLVLSGCATTPKTTLTPLEIQALQTRTYEHSKDIAFPSVMSVFQDLGYTVNSADKDTGLITAESATASDAASKFWLGITDVSQTKATAFIEQMGSSSSVRLNFVATNKKSTMYGRSDRQDTPILDAAVYQNAFERIENAIFMRSSN
ncbi:hypothetical protein NYF23_07970 [SAR92 clade bacterium H455]|uniref:DUF4136 domain-containing protein n=1 Tax=SAR92 clade bacterium H455 TaxID=2974818 RepID=A0ABY5TNT5_9GAMM|nr:hypothetical protein NYF23_07970 [SAR92 clade bacterium H455]